MNKYERNLKGRHKWIKRLKNFSLWNKGKPERGTYCFKEQGTPCSCPMCAGESYKRATKHKKNIKLEFYDEFHHDLINELNND